MPRPRSEPTKSGPPAHQAPSKATCRFPDGETRVLMAKRFSTRDLFILAVRPPPIGTVVQVTLEPAGLAPLPPVEARVVSMFLDPSNARNCGFGAVFHALDDDVLGAFDQALAAMGLNLALPMPAGPQILERRCEPRVSLNLSGQVSYGGKTLSGRVTSLSMTGAMVALEASHPPSDLTAGTILQLDIISEEAPEVITVTAKVVRQFDLGTQTGIGLQFCVVKEVSASRIEGLILNVLWTPSLAEPRP